jgi:hypothetical protein
MLKLRGLVCSLLCVGVCLCAASSAHAKPDIVGYRSGKNVWKLGEQSDDVDLSGFADFPSDFDGVTSYADLRRTIQFDGEDTKAAIRLDFDGNSLAGLLLTITDDEKSYRTLRHYYLDRYDDLDRIINEPEMIAWEDDDGDVLAVYSFRSNDGEKNTAVYYMDDALYTRVTGDAFPGWIRDLMKTYLDS